MCDSYADSVHLFCYLGSRRDWQFVSLLGRTLEFNGLINKVDLICLISRMSRSGVQSSVRAFPGFLQARHLLVGLCDC